MLEEWKTVDWFKSQFVNAGFEPGKVQVHRTTIRVLFEDMWQECRAHMCKAVVMLAKRSWSKANGDALYEELMRRFDPKTANSDGFDHDTLLLVAKK